MLQYKHHQANLQVEHTLNKNLLNFSVTTEVDDNLEIIRDTMRITTSEAPNDATRRGRGKSASASIFHRWSLEFESDLSRGRSREGLKSENPGIGECAMSTRSA